MRNIATQTGNGTAASSVLSREGLTRRDWVTAGAKWGRCSRTGSVYRFLQVQVVSATAPCMWVLPVIHQDRIGCSADETQRIGVGTLTVENIISVVQNTTYKKLENIHTLSHEHNLTLAFSSIFALLTVSRLACDTRLQTLYPLAIVAASVPTRHARVCQSAVAD